MKTDKKKGKRGRPRKHPIKIETEPAIKRGRGRPPKVKDLKNIEMVKKKEDIKEENYVEPKIHRKIRVFRFDRSIFHAFAKKFNGDLITMSYIVDKLMSKYLDHKIKIDKMDKSFKYYREWCKGSPPLEPVGSNDLAQASAVSRGIPLQYKYSLIIDEDTYNKFQKHYDYYPPFLINILVKMYLNEENKISIDIRKASGWCNFE